MNSFYSDKDNLKMKSVTVLQNADAQTIVCGMLYFNVIKGKVGEQHRLI